LLVLLVIGGQGADQGEFSDEFCGWRASEAAGDGPRQRIQFPPFSPDHLDNPLAHLADLVTA
jgi:hypothetical protein